MRKFLIRFLVVGFSILLILTALEVTVRILWQRIQGPIIPMSLKIHQVAANKKIGYELIPGSETFLDDSWYRINALGLRDFSTFTKEKPAGVFRIAAVGDSLTFGMAVALEESWPKLLEKRLVAIRPKIEVLNFGVMGYDTPQEAEQIREKILPFSPDLIVIGYSLTDIGILSRERRELKQYRGYHAFFSTGIGFLDRGLAHSKLYMLLKNRLFLWRTQSHRKPPPFSRDGYRVLQIGYNRFLIDGYYQKENLDRLRAAFASIQESTKGKVPVLVAIFPDLSDFTHYIYKDVQKIVADIVTENGLFILDPLPSFQKHDPAELRISQKNVHGNRKGYDLFASAIADFLKTHHLLPQ